MFNTGFGGQISWLLPAALLLLAAGLVWTLRRPRTDRSRAALIVWGGWLLVTGIVFSLSGGIIHQYYTVALAPAIAALIGIGGSMAWDRRNACQRPSRHGHDRGCHRGLDRRRGGPHPRLEPLADACVGGAERRGRRLVVLGDRVRRGAVTATAVGVVLAVGAGLVAPLAASATTVATPHVGAIVTAGPTVRRTATHRPATGRPVTASPMPRAPVGGPPGSPRPTEVGGPHSAGVAPMLRTRRPSPHLLAVLRAGHRRFEWLVATTWSMNAAGYSLATGQPALAIGGFNGTDPDPTLSQFERLVADGRVHWYIATSERALRAEQLGGSQEATRIGRWVRHHFTPRVVDGITLYDVTQTPSGPTLAVSPGRT